MQMIAPKLLAAQRVLIMTHLRPDGDALGSTFGMRQFLLDNGIAADVLLPGTMPKRYQTLCQDAVKEVTPETVSGYDLFLTLDCANPERLGCVEACSLPFLQSANTVNIDHHGGNSLEIPCKWIDAGAASTCLMTAELLLSTGKIISPECATFLLAGMMTDTGCFCFANTNGRALRGAAEMTDRGADVEKITNALFFSKELKQLKFESELINNHLQTACNGRFAYMYIPDELLKKYDFDLREDEGLIDIVRSVDGAVIAMLSHRRSDGFRVSLRSKDRNFPVGSIARHFGGGGHEMAAGCTICAETFADVEKILLPEIASLLNH